MVEYPELSSKKHWVQRGISVIKQYFPGVLKYLSRQKILSNLHNYKIIIRSHKKHTDDHIKTAFNVWLKKEKSKRFIMIIIEAAIIPLTVPMALLPGPNFFFYIPALFLYFHWQSYKGLRKTDAHSLNIEIIHLERMDIKKD